MEVLLKKRLPYAPAVSLLDIQRKLNQYVGEIPAPPVFITALLLIAKIWNQPMYFPKMDE